MDAAEIISKAVHEGQALALRDTLEREAGFQFVPYREPDNA